MRKELWIILFIFAVIGIGSAAMAQDRTYYRQQEDCYLCSKQESPIASLYSNVSGIGLLNFNDFTISTLRICNKETDMPTSDFSTTINSGGEDGSTIFINSNLNRRIADVTISLRDGSRPDQKEIARFLCSNCCKRIEQENKYDVAFLDYQTNEIVSIEENLIEFYINDYAIHRLNPEDELEYLVFYAPEQ